MTKQKYYAVKKGNKQGIFLTWAECQDATKGFSGPEYKAFESEEAAQAYINDEDIALKNDIIPRLQLGKVVAFTDGCFDVAKKAYGAGVCIFARDNIYQELSSRGSNEKYIELRNIAGEIIAVLNAIDWAWKNGYESISIFHDYEGISKWATGEWQTKNALTRYYKQYIDDKSGIIEIEFVKVKGHSNNKYNDRADKLAKGAIFENRVIRDLCGNSGYIISPVNEDDITSLLEKLKFECNGLDYNNSCFGVKKSWQLQFKKEKVSLSLFNNIKLTVQGKKSTLFQIVTTGIIEMLQCGDFIKVLKDAYGIVINRDQVDIDFKNELPRINSLKLPENISILLKQSIINLSNPARSDREFTMYTFPVLRALEGVLKYNLQKCAIPIEKRFCMFEKSNGIYKLETKYRAGLSVEKIAKLENCYNHLYNNRHTLFHFGIILDGTDVNTRLLNTKAEADSIIKDTLKIIDDNYIE